MLWWLSDDARLSDPARDAIAAAEEPLKPQRDPFDRLLVAQAETERIPLVTCDSGIVAHGILTIW